MSRHSLGTLARLRTAPWSLHRNSADEAPITPTICQFRAGFSKSFVRYLFAVFHSAVLTFIQPLRVPDR